MSLFTWLMFLGLASAVLLNLLRTGQGKAERGILMGYSGLVVTLIIIGGALVLWGVLRLSWKSAEPPAAPRSPERHGARVADALRLSKPGLSMSA
jgi:hypothetical protein